VDSEVELILLFLRSLDSFCYKQTNKDRVQKKVQRQRGKTRAFCFFYCLQFYLILQWQNTYSILYFSIVVNKFIFTLAKNKIKSKSKRQTIS